MTTNRRWRCVVGANYLMEDDMPARIELTNAELQMVEVLRQVQGEAATFQLIIERTDGAWEIRMMLSPRGGRGVGRTFDDAWISMDPDWA
jgi:hypothetical protein